KAILLSTLIILGLSVLGTLAVAIVIPHERINLLSGGIDALRYFFQAYHLEWMMPLLSLLIGFGSFSAVVTWIIGPSRGLLTAAQDGDLPPFLHKTNSYGMPTTMLIVQGFIVTVLSSIFLFIPDISSSFWILIALASILYNMMYIMMFVAAIMLKYQQPHTPRPYAIPGNKLGMWMIGGLGLLVAGFTFIIGFFPPSNITFSTTSYVLTLVLGTALFATLPFLILIFKRSSWNIDKAKVTEGESTKELTS
ncbi:MAG: amino acid permease, partial [Chlamydiae bacterium]|nr:amino acid permease [Chlamydiota bacterium]